MEDIINGMALMLQRIEKDDLQYKNFKWFSTLKYLSTTEYLGELGLFLKDLLDRNKYPAYQKEINDIYRAAKNLSGLES